jgi:hypothetical protein
MFAAVLLMLAVVGMVLAKQPRLALNGVGFGSGFCQSARGAVRGLVSAFANTGAGSDGKAWGPQDDNLRLSNAQTLAQTGDSTVTVDLGEGYEPDPYESVNLLVDTTARDHTTGDETYSVTVWESADDSSWTSTGLTFTITAVGQVNKLVGLTKRYVKLILTLAGTTPSITFSAWLNPAKK